MSDLKKNAKARPISTAAAPARHHLDRRADEIAGERDGDDDDLLSTPELADWLGVSEEWVEIGRSKHYGPPFVRIGPKRIRYRRGNVREWLKSRTHSCTAEYSRKLGVA